MNRFFNPESEIWRGFAYAFDIFVLSLTWVLISSLFLTTGLATSGLYYSVNNYLVNRKVVPLKGYAISIKQNWKIAIVANLVLMLLGIAIAWSMWISYQVMVQGVLMGRVIFFFGVVIAIYFIGYVAYVFPILGAYHYDLKGLLSISFKLSIMHLPITILFALIYIATGLFAYYFWISLFFTPVLVMLIQRKLLNSIFEKHTN